MEAGNIIYLLMLLVLVGGAFFTMGNRSQNINMLLIWAGIILVLVLGYRIYERAKFTPKQIADGSYTVTIPYDRRAGGYRVTFDVNGSPIDGVIDTGATELVLTHSDAIKAGIDTQSLSYSMQVDTANGQTFAAHANIDKLNFGDVILNDVDALIAQNDDLSQTLIGMSVLRKFRSFHVSGDEMMIEF